MVEHPGSNSQEEKRRSLRGLLFWLGLFPVILGSLFCCAQVALLAVPGRDWSADTRSLLIANYLPWEYQEIPPLKLAELIKDIEQDEKAQGEPKTIETVVVYWVPPTPTSTVISVAIGTGTPAANATSTATLEGPAATSTTRPTTGPTATATATQRSLTSTPTNPPTKTLPPPTKTPTTPPPTRTATQPPPPTWTYTPPPRPPDPTSTFTATPVPPSATPVTPSATPVTPSATPVTPSATPVTPTVETPVPPSPTPETPSPTPTYAPVWPIAENDGASTPVPGGCRASFGYRNDNPQAVDIPIGPLNQISDDTAAITPFQPTRFLVGRVSGAFEVFWTSGGPIFWSLDGRLATANWCGATVP